MAKQSHTLKTINLKSSVPQNIFSSNHSHKYPKLCPFSKISDIKGLNVLVMGLGLHGGGEASARFFLKHGAFVTITDLKTQAELKPTIHNLESDPSLDMTRARFVLGRHEIQDFQDADIVIKNPSIKIDQNPFLIHAKHIETDLSIFLRFTKAPIIAITGSKGKSSTATAIYFGLQEAGFQAFLGGNITNSPLNFLEQTNSQTPVVLELSSWQLSDLRGRKILKPKIAIITKIVPDHLNWYCTMENYIADKQLIYKDQDKTGYTICSTDNWGELFTSQTKAQVLRYSSMPFNNKKTIGAWIETDQKGYISQKTRLLFSKGTEDLIIDIKNTDKHLILDELLVPGPHMKENILIACLALIAFGVSPNKTADIMSRFPGVPHRLEYFHRFTRNNKQKTQRGTEDLKNHPPKSLLFYNDSAATVPEAVIAALDSFSKPIHLICGGTDKNLVFTELSYAVSKTKTLYLLEGTGTELLIQELHKSSVPFFGPFCSLNSLLLCLKNNLDNESPKKDEEIILFSPGATSFGMFSNEFDRGNAFKKAVLEFF